MQQAENHRAGQPAGTPIEPDKSFSDYVREKAQREFAQQVNNYGREPESQRAPEPADTPIEPAKFVADHPVFRGSTESFRWFLRQHRGELVEAGGLIAPTGRLLVMPAKFNQAVQRIGQRMAATKLR